MINRTGLWSAQSMIGLGACAALLLLTTCMTAVVPPSLGEVEKFKRQIAGCWTMPVGVEDIEGIENVVILMHVKVRPDRTVESITLLNEGLLEHDPAYRAVAQSALEAVEKCGPLNLPSGKYAVWREILMNFYPGDALER